MDERNIWKKIKYVLAGIVVANIMNISCEGKARANPRAVNVKTESICNSDNPHYRKAKKAWKNMMHYTNYIEQASKQTGLPESLIKGIITQESVGYLKARSFAGALGPVQFMKSTARNYDINMNPYEDYRNHPESIINGAEYLRNLLNEECKNNKNKLDCALQKYSGNARNYAKKVRNLANIFETCKDYFKIPEEPIFKDFKKYRVKSGDTFWDIRKKYCMDKWTAYFLNPQIKNPNKIIPGMEVFVKDFCKGKNYGELALYKPKKKNIPQFEKTNIKDKKKKKQAKKDKTQKIQKNEKKDNEDSIAILIITSEPLEIEIKVEKE